MYIKITKELLEENGYQNFPVPPTKEYASMFLQKRITMGEGFDEDFFIDAFFYDYRKYSTEAGTSWSFETQLGENKTFNVETVGWESPTLEEIENFFKNLYFFSRWLENKERVE